MSSADFYRDRILWKAGKHSLIGDQCVLFPDLPHSDREFLARAISEEVDPVLVFWGGRDQWTVLGTGTVCSYVENNLNCEELDKIGKQVKLHADEGSTQEESKLESCFILVGKREKKIWAPPGPKLFALMNILLMFPLGEAAGKA